MKKFVIALLLIVLTAFTAQAEYNLNFTLSNESGYRFNEIWIKPSSNLEWNRTYDLITPRGSKNPTRLASGKTTKITFDNVSSSRKNTPYWDLYVKCSNGREGLWTNIRLSGIVLIRIDRQLTAHPVTASELMDLF